MHATLLAPLLLSLAGGVADASRPATMDDLAFMAGSWSGEALGGHCEETWLAPKGGTMVGVFRLTRGEATPVTEFLQIEDEESGPVLRFKHYGPGWREWESDAPLIFETARVQDGRVVFESRTQTHPKRMTYWLDDEGRLNVRVEGGEAGKEESFVVVMGPAEDE